MMVFSVIFLLIFAYVLWRSLQNDVKEFRTSCQKQVGEFKRDCEKIRDDWAKVFMSDESYFLALIIEINRNKPNNPIQIRTNGINNTQTEITRAESDDGTLTRYFVYCRHPKPLKGSDDEFQETTEHERGG